MKLGRRNIITITYKQNQVTSILQDLRDQKTSATSVDVLLSDGDQDHYIIITKVTKFYFKKSHAINTPVKVRQVQPITCHEGPEGK
jgi:hypothetical protein